MRTNMLLVLILLLGLIIPQAASQAEVTLVGSLIYPNASGAYWSEAGYNAYANEYMAIWTDVTDPNGWQDKGQRINATTGSLVGSVFYISDNPTGYGALGTEVTYNPVNNEWFMVYILQQLWSNNGFPNSMGIKKYMSNSNSILE